MKSLIWDISSCVRLLDNAELWRIWNAWPTPFEITVSTGLPVSASATQNRRVLSLRMSSSDTHTIVEGTCMLRKALTPADIGLHQGWSRLAPRGRESRQYVSEAARVRAELDVWVDALSLSDWVLSSAPKNGWIKIKPFSTSGAIVPLDPTRLATLYAMLAPALSPTMNTFNKLHWLSHHLCSLHPSEPALLTQESTLRPSS